MEALTKSLMDSPIRLQRSLSSSWSSVGMRAETVLDTCLHLSTVVNPILDNMETAEPKRFGSDKKNHGPRGIRENIGTKSKT